MKPTIVAAVALLLSAASISDAFGPGRVSSSSSDTTITSNNINNNESPLFFAGDKNSGGEYDGIVMQPHPPTVPPPERLLRMKDTSLHASSVLDASEKNHDNNNIDIATALNRAQQAAADAITSPSSRTTTNGIVASIDKKKTHQFASFAPLSATLSNALSSLSTIELPKAIFDLVGRQTTKDTWTSQPEMDVDFTAVFDTVGNAAGRAAEVMKPMIDEMTIKEEEIAPDVPQDVIDGAFVAATATTFLTTHNPILTALAGLLSFYAVNSNGFGGDVARLVGTATNSVGYACLVAGESTLQLCINAVPAPTSNAASSMGNAITDTKNTISAGAESMSQNASAKKVIAELPTLRSRFLATVEAMGEKIPAADVHRRMDTSIATKSKDMDSAVQAVNDSHHLEATKADAVLEDVASEIASAGEEVAKTEEAQKPANDYAFQQARLIIQLQQAHIDTEARVQEGRRRMLELSIAAAKDDGVAASPPTAKVEDLFHDDQERKWAVERDELLARQLEDRSQQAVSVEGVESTAMAFKEKKAQEPLESLKIVSSLKKPTGVVGIDLSLYSSPYDLSKKFGAGTLKAELTRLGLKCGGTKLERAQRLFLTKDTPIAKLSKKHLAKSK